MENNELGDVREGKGDSSGIAESNKGENSDVPTSSMPVAGSLASGINQSEIGNLSSMFKKSMFENANSSFGDLNTALVNAYKAPFAEVTQSTLNNLNSSVQAMSKQIASSLDVSKILSPSLEKAVKSLNDPIEELYKNIAINFNNLGKNAAELPKWAKEPILVDGIRDTVASLDTFDSHPVAITENAENKVSLHESTKTQWHQLIVLGNGFDLECGLNSHYSDFENPRVEKIKEFYDNSDRMNRFIALLIEHKMTIWDLLLGERKNNLWSDIEKEIANRLSVTDYWCNNILKKLNSGHSEDFLFDSRKVKASTFEAQIDGIVCEYIKTVSSPVGKDWSLRDIFDILLKHLHQYEDAFCAYLENEVHSNGRYQENALNLLSKITMYQKPDEPFVSVQSSLLNFNFTNPWRLAQNNLYPNKKFDSMVNIHGNIEDHNLIFGVDGKECMEDSNLRPFTKTFRIMSMQDEGINHLFYTQRQLGDTRDATNVIKFYGHSLSPSDYSYFQSIFDGVNLYNGNTKLLFFYRPRKDDFGACVSDEQARLELTNNIAQLISEYGKTFDNIAHGQNLSNKLIMEGRLRIVSI